MVLVYNMSVRLIQNMKFRQRHLNRATKIIGIGVLDNWITVSLLLLLFVSHVGLTFQLTKQTKRVFAIPASTPQPQSILALFLSCRGWKAEMAWVAGYNTKIVCPPEDVRGDKTVMWPLAILLGHVFHY